MTSGKAPIISGILIVARSPRQLRVLQRIISHLPSHRNACASTVKEAESEIMKHEPEAVIIDVSEYPSGAIRHKIEPFVLSLPGWVKTFFVDSRPTANRVSKARELGVLGVLTTPLSHHGISQLFCQIVGIKCEECPVADTENPTSEDTLRRKENGLNS